jgi:hypothetical protein
MARMPSFAAARIFPASANERQEKVRDLLTKGLWKACGEHGIA